MKTNNHKKAKEIRSGRNFPPFLSLQSRQTSQASETEKGFHVSLSALPLHKEIYAGNVLFVSRALS